MEINLMHRLCALVVCREVGFSDDVFNAGLDELCEEYGTEVVAEACVKLGVQ